MRGVASDDAVNDAATMLKALADCRTLARNDGADAQLRAICVLVSKKYHVDPDELFARWAPGRPVTPRTRRK
jgi:hypothetical protein